MQWFTGIVVYVLVWWVVIFAVLPWGARNASNPEPGTVESAPDKPRLGLKFLVTSGIAAVIWGVIYVLIKSDVISFRDIAGQMPMQ